MRIATGYTALSRVLAGIQASLADLTLHLASAAIIVDGDTLIADFTEADYDGYVAKAVADTGVIYLTDELDVVWEAASSIFQPTGDVTPNTIFAWWLEGTVGGTGARFVSGATLDEPVILAGPLTALTVRPRIVLGQASGTFGPV